MSDERLRPLATETDWTDALSHSDEEPVVVFKHSSACSVSAQADEHVRRLDDRIPVYKLVVQENRALSDQIADTLEIRHETPQVIILDDGTPAFSTSHFDVTTDTLREALRSIGNST